MGLFLFLEKTFTAEAQRKAFNAALNPGYDLG